MPRTREPWGSGGKLPQNSAAEGDAPTTLVNVFAILVHILLLFDKNKFFDNFLNKWPKSEEKI